MAFFPEQKLLGKKGQRFCFSWVRIYYSRMELRDMIIASEAYVLHIGGDEHVCCFERY